MTDDAVGVCSLLAPWRALRVRSNAERSVQSALLRNSIEQFLPVSSSERLWSDRKRIIERPIFPGYIFARLSDIAPVLSIAGVCGVLGGNLTPAVVPDSDIENIKLVIASLVPLTPADFVAGDRVTVRNGALKGVSGVVVRHSRGLRLVVNVDMLGRAIAVEIDAAALEIAQKAAA